MKLVTKPGLTKDPESSEDVRWRAHELRDTNTEPKLVVQDERQEE